MTMTEEEQDWKYAAACKGMAVEAGYDLFYEEENEKRAKEICAGCDVRIECLQEALVDGHWFGVFGGMNPKERESHHRRWRYATRNGDRSREALLQYNKEKG